MVVGSRAFQKRLRKRLQEKRRALYVRLPHTIRNKEDVAQLFSGTFKVNLTRQSTRHCYVVFPSVEEQEKNLKDAKNIKINGKAITVERASTKFKKPKAPKKKIVIPKIEEDPKITKALFVSNIKCGTKAQEIKEAFEGCIYVKLLKPYDPVSRAAIIKMESIPRAAEYLLKTREIPVVNERKLKISLDTRKRNKHRKPERSLKIYGESGEISNFKIEDIGDTSNSDADENEG